MLCQSCKNIFQGHFYSDHDYSTSQASLDRMIDLLHQRCPVDRKYRPHQPNISRLYQSALDECWICTQIFEDVCKKIVEINLCREDSTPAEIATTKIQEGESSTANFAVYELRFNKDSNRENGGDMTLCISVDCLVSPWSGSYLYNLAPQRGMLINA
jgi:hypothetical protein